MRIYAAQIPLYIFFPFLKRSNFRETRKKMQFLCCTKEEGEKEELETPENS